MSSGIPKELCDQLPEIKGYGIYRRLNNGKYEFVSYCIPQAQNYVAINKHKFYKVLDEYLPKKK